MSPKGEMSVHLTSVELAFTASLPEANRRRDWLDHIAVCGLCELTLASMEGRYTTATWDPFGAQPNRGERGQEGTP